MSENAMTDQETSDVFDRWVRTFQVYQLAAGERGTVTITYTSDDAGEMARSLRVCANVSKCARRVLAARQEVEAERRGLDAARRGVETIRGRYHARLAGRRKLSLAWFMVGFAAGAPLEALGAAIADLLS